MDLRFVARSYWRNPVYALTGVVLLAGAVAVNAAVLSFVRGTLLAEPTFPDPDRVVVAWGSNALDGQIRDVVSGPTFLDLRDRSTTIDHLSALTIESAVLLEDGRPVVLDVEAVSVDFFRAVPVVPHLGRTFDERERTSGGPASILVSYAFWQERLGGDPGVVGRTLPLDGEPHTVVGVLPPGFRFIMPSPVWAPLHDDLLAADDRGRIHYHLVGRLRAGVGPADATRELSAVMADVAREHPGFQGWSILVERIRDAAVVGVRPTLLSLAGAMTLVLLVALANLVTLFRIRTVGRADELRVRRALGGSRVRLARVLALEAMGITLTGAALGLAVAPWVLAAVRDRVPVWIAIPDSAARIPALQASLDPWVVGGVMAMALLCGALLALPAVLSGVRAGASLRPRGARGSAGAPGTRWMVVGELALATVLCVGAGLSVRSAHHLMATDIGLDTADLLGMWVGDVWDRPDEEQAAYFNQVVDAVEALPEVHAAATIDYLPFLQEDDYARVYFLDRDGQSVRDQREEWRRVGDALFETAGMRMVEGRSFLSDELLGRPRSAVINEAFARKHYPDGDAVGSFLSTHDDRYQGLEIVGVVADVRAHGPARPAPPVLYVPHQGRPRGTVGLYVRTRPGQAAASAEAVRDAIWSVDPSQPVTGVVPMAELVDSWVALPRTVRALVSAVAALAVFLTGVGVFGVVGYAVRRRTAEFGVRVALGASPRRLRREILGSVAPMVGAGIGAGLLAGVGAAYVGAALFQGVAPWDPVSLAGALAVISAAAMTAAWLPARAAAAVDPAHSIRGE